MLADGAVERRCPIDAHAHFLGHLQLRAGSLIMLFDHLAFQVGLVSGICALAWRFMFAGSTCVDAAG